MDITGATKATKMLLTNPSFVSSAPFLSDKADWNTQVLGAYNLLFTHIHDDFGVRRETEEYVGKMILDALTNHNDVNRHNGAYSTKGIPTPVIISQIRREQMESYMFKSYLSSNGVSTFMLKVKIPIKPEEMIFNTIGYGV